MSLRVICAWCKTFLRGDPNSSQISHGICPDCLRKVIREQRKAAAEVWALWQDEGGGD